MRKPHPAFLAFVSLVLLAAAAVAGEPEPEFDGLTATAWGDRLASPDAEVQDRAYLSLTEGGADAAPVLGILVLDSRRDVCMVAGSALRRLGARGRAAVPYLLRAIGNADPEFPVVPAGASFLLCELPFEDLLGYARDDGPALRRGALRAILEVRFDLGEHLEDVLETWKVLPGSDLRTRLASALTGELLMANPDVSAVLPAFFAVPEFRVVVLRRLADRHAVAAVWAAPVLTALKATEPREVRLAALRALRVLTPTPTDAASVVAPLLREEDAEIRGEALRTFVALRPPSEVVLPALLAAAEDPHEFVRTVAAAALVPHLKEAPDRVVPALARMFTADAPSDLRREIAEALGAEGSAASAAVPALATALDDSDDRVCSAAASALARIGGPGIAALEVRLGAEDPERRALTVNGLGDGGKAAVPVLVRALVDESARVRCAAVMALGRVGADAGSAVLALVGGLEGDADLIVVAKAALALGQIGLPAAGAKAALERATGHEDVRVQVAAIKALAQVRGAERAEAAGPERR